MPNVKGDWIHPDAQSVEELMHVAKSCPSGAIRVLLNAPAVGQARDSDGAPIVNTLRVRENGPLAIEAELLISGVAQQSPRATLCRCGQSQGTDSLLQEAVGSDLKGKVSLASHLTSVPLALLGLPWLAGLLLAAVSLIWFIPDRRIEKKLV